MKIGFIGLGNMASAIIGGMLQKELVRPENILGSARRKETVEKAVENLGITGMESNVETASKSDILFLSVKPQMYETVIAEIKDSARKDAVIVSIAPGKTMEWLEGQFGKK